MDVDQIKENLPALGEEAVISGKMMSSTGPPHPPSVTMATPRQPLMDLSQVPRPTTEDWKLTKSTSKLKTATPVCTPQSKKTSRKLQPSTLIYQDKKTATQPDQTERLNPVLGSSAPVHTVYFDKLSESFEDKELDSLVASVLNQCMEDIVVGVNRSDQSGDCTATDSELYTKVEPGTEMTLEDEGGSDPGNGSGKDSFQDMSNISLLTSGDQDRSADDLSKNNMVDHTYSSNLENQDTETNSQDVNEKEDTKTYFDHTYCFKPAVIKSNTASFESNTKSKDINTDHAYCGSGSNEMFSSDNGQECDYIETSQTEDQLDTLGESQRLIDDGEHFIERSNISGTEYVYPYFMEVEVCQECEPETYDDKNAFMSADLVNNVQNDSNDTEQLEKSDKLDWIMSVPACSSHNSALDSDTVNPQGVTYITSPTCVKPYKFSPAMTNSVTSPKICNSLERGTSQHDALKFSDSSFCSENSETVSEDCLSVEKAVVYDLVDKVEASLAGYSNENDNRFKELNSSEMETVCLSGHCQSDDCSFIPSSENVQASSPKSVHQESLNKHQDVDSVKPLKCSEICSLPQDEIQGILAAASSVKVNDSSLTTEHLETYDIYMATDTSDIGNDMACSPIPLSHCDASIQNSPDMRSAMNSPFVPYETQNISINTDTSDTSDASVGTEAPATIYVSVIKDQPAVRDRSVSTDSAESSNVSISTDTTFTDTVSTNTDAHFTSDAIMMTDSTKTVEVGIEVRPDIMTVSTEMTDFPMTTVGTSMTPVKMVNKFGKRLTADDVRKQHPRALANQLETFKLQNERLESQVRSLEHERDRLRTAAKESKASLGKVEKQLEDLETGQQESENKVLEMRNQCEELEGALQKQTQAHTLELEELQNKCEQLELEKTRIRKEHSDEIRTLRETYEETNYQDHFLASQKLVQQLQSELSQYTQLLEDIEHSHQIQADLEEKMSASFSKVKVAGETVLSLHRTLKAKEIELSVQRSDLLRQDASVKEEQARITTEREEMQEIVSCCKTKMEELDVLYQKSCEDLGEATSKVSSLQTDLNETKTELSRAEEGKQILEEKVKELTQAEEKLMHETEILQTALKQKEEQESAMNARLSELQMSLQKETEAHKKTVQKYSLEEVNLQRTLDSREQDIDVLEKDLFECREIIYTQMEKIRNFEEREKSTQSELRTLDAENLELRGCCAVLRGKEQELQETLKYTLEELSGTREHASRLLKEQGTEIADCSTAIGELTDHMTAVLTNLNKKAGLQKTPMKKIVEEKTVPHNSNVPLDLTKPFQDPEPSQGSLVSMILNAAKSQDSKHMTTEEPVQPQSLSDNNPNFQSDLGTDENKTFVESRVQDLKTDPNNIDSPNTVSRKKLGFTGSSAFAPVSSGRMSECVRSNTVGQNSSSAAVLDGQSVKIMNTKIVSENNKECENLPDQMTKVSEMFVEINRVVGLIEKASRSALQDMRRENDDLSSRLSQCEFTESRLHTELEYNQRELQKSKQLSEELREKLEEMGDRLGQYMEHEAEVKRLQQEIGHLHGKQQSLEAEKEFLNDQMKELLQRLEQSTEATQTSGVDFNSQKEILTLQKKVHRLREQLQEKHDFIEEISNKAAHRIQKLEENWKKADAEVLRFDELVDVVRKTLITNETLMEKNEEIRKIVRLIDGQEPVSSFRKSAQLKPIKTSKW